MTKTVSITFRAPADLKKTLAQRAKAEDRSVSYVIERLLREALGKPK